MNLQYISDSNGKTTGVFIPINEWNMLKSKFEGLENEIIDIPEWQINEVRERVAEYKKNPAKHSLDLKDTLKELEDEL
jgi:hypothetical protein